MNLFKKLKTTVDDWMAYGFVREASDFALDLNGLSQVKHKFLIKKEPCSFKGE